jgi:hypothetical protein
MQSTAFRPKQRSPTPAARRLRGADYPMALQIGERSPLHTNPSPTSGVALAYTRHPAFAWRPPMRQFPPLSLRTAPSLRSAPGFCLNRVTSRPTSHFFPPLAFTRPKKKSPRFWEIVSFVLYVAANAVYAPSAITPAAATPITIASRFLRFMSISLPWGSDPCQPHLPHQCAGSAAMVRRVPRIASAGRSALHEDERP